MTLYHKVIPAIQLPDYSITRIHDAEGPYFSANVPVGVIGPTIGATGRIAAGCEVDDAGWAGCSAPLPFGARLRRGRISYRLIISFNVVGLMCRSSAARFC